LFVELGSRETEGARLASFEALMFKVGANENWSEEIAKLAVYLASDDSAYVVGADFLIDGGVTAISAVGA